MNCKSCGSTKALYQTDKEQCQLCQHIPKKKPYDIKKRRGVARPNPIKATGKFCGEVRYFQSVNEAALFFDKSDTTIRALLKRGAPTNQTTWRLEHVTVAEYERGVQ